MSLSPSSPQLGSNHGLVLPHASIAEAFRFARHTPELATTTLWTQPEKAPRHKSEFKKINWRSGTIEELGVQVDALANFLTSLQLSPPSKYQHEARLNVVGPRIGVIASMRPEFLAAIQAIFKIGGVVVPILPSLRAERVHHILNDAGVEVVFAESLDEVKKLFPDPHMMGAGSEFASPSIKHVITFETDKIPQMRVDTRFSSFDGAVRIGGSKVQSSIVESQANDLAAILYTSGTTGASKGVNLTHGNLLSVAEGAIEADLLRPFERILAILPPAHVYLFVASIIASTKGLCLCMPPTSPLTKTVLEFVSSYSKAQVVPLVPQVLEGIHLEILQRHRVGSELQISDLIGRGRSKKQVALNEWLQMKGLSYALDLRAKNDTSSDLPTRVLLPAAKAFLKIAVSRIFGDNVRYMVVGSAKLGYPTAHFFNEIMGVRTCEGYGATETCAVTAVTDIKKRDTEFGTVGQPLPGTKVELTESGEIVVQGPCVAHGYWNRPSDTAERFDFSGYFPRYKTGDGGRVSKLGNLVVNGRIGEESYKLKKGEFVDCLAMEKAIFFQCSELVQEVIVFGEFENFNSALVYLKEGARRDFAKRFRLDPVAVSTDLQVKKVLLNRLNDIRDLESNAPFETHCRIAGAIIAEEPFLRTGTERVAKIRRKDTLALYSAQVASLYHREEAQLPSATLASTTKINSVCRRLLPNEVELAVRLLSALPADEQYNRFGTPRPDPELYRKVITFEDRKRHLCIGAPTGGGLKSGEISAYGSCVLTDSEKHCGELDFAVHPDHLRRGYGYQLLVSLVQEARSLGIIQIELLVQNENYATLQLLDKGVRNGLFSLVGVKYDCGAGCRTYRINSPI